MVRKGIGLIELVLAIVVIAISVMTVPMMLQQGTKSDTFSMMQEAILAARTKMGNVLSYQWDEYSMESNNTYGRLRALDVANGDPALDRNATYYPERRIGHVYGNLRRKMKPGTAPNLFPKPGADANITDLNDFDNLSTQIVWQGASTASDRYDYLDKNLTLSTKVYYISDTPSAGTDYNSTTVTFVFNPAMKQNINGAYSTNIKMVELNVTTQSYPAFMFRVFSCNLGETGLLERDIN